MSFKQTLLASGVLLCAASFNADASLNSYTANGANFVYSSLSDISWAENANLFWTMASSNPGLVTQISSITPTYDDPFWGLQSIDASHFNASSGEMTWWGAKAFVNYLNEINYGGSNEWRLPTSNAVADFDGTAGNELGQLFYGELGGTPGGLIPISLQFLLQDYEVYWTGMEDAQNLDGAWEFQTYNGAQSIRQKSSQHYAWVVSPGLVSAVPVPSAVWMFGSDILGVLGLKRRGK